MDGGERADQSEEMPKQQKAGRLLPRRRTGGPLVRK